MASPDKTKTKGQPKVANQPERLFDDEIGLKQVTEIVGLSANRVRRLNSEGKIPGGKRNSKGWWRFSRAAIEAWAKDRPSRSFGSADGRRTYKVRLNDEEVEVLRNNDLEPKLAYQKKAKKEAQAEG